MRIAQFVHFQVVPTARGQFTIWGLDKTGQLWKYYDHDVGWEKFEGPVRTEPRNPRDLLFELNDKLLIINGQIEMLGDGEHTRDVISKLDALREDRDKVMHDIREVINGNG